MTVRGILQTETHELHARLHKLQVFRDLLKQQLSVNRYCALVERLYGFYEPLDPALATGVALLPGRLSTITYQLRAPMLSADLADLGVGERAQDRLPRCGILPAIATSDRILGTLYVVEGSVQGGKLLFQQLSNVFGPTQVAGRRYLRWCADQDGARWSRLCAALEARSNHAGALQDMIESARETFSALMVWLSEIEAATPVDGRMAAAE